MREILIVAEREFLERVRSKAFIISTVLIPVIMVGALVLPTLLGRDVGGERRMVVVDEGPPGVTDAMVAVLTAPREGRGGIRYEVEVVREPFESVRDALTARVQQKELDGYIHVPADVATSSSLGYRAREITNANVSEDIRRAASTAVQAHRLQAAGLDGSEVAALVRPVRTEAVRITARGEEEGSGAIGSMVAGMVAVWLMFMMIMMYGATIMTSVLEEKTSRISEVIVSSLKASHLMAGKIVGVGSTALFQVGIWVAFALLLFTQAGTMAAMFGVSPQMLQALRLEPAVGLALLLFFLAGYFLYGSLFAAVGAASNSTEEAQQFVFPLQIPILIPLFFMMRVIQDPMGTAAQVLSWIPFTAPMVMPIRMAVTSIPLHQIVGSLAVVMLTVVAAFWVTGKIYRVGILSTGKKPTFRELGQWLRAA
jgi:ABC-2 type transport system permease protein